NEEKPFIWTDRDTGAGRLRQSTGKGKRLAISASMGPSDFHASSIDIFECNEDHNMYSAHFLTWIDRTASLLRKELAKISLLSFSLLFLDLGKGTKIILVIDNATWHSRLPNDTTPPKR
ncbi:unnamed protein product, partial [Rotaria sp. Silwood2]